VRVWTGRRRKVEAAAGVPSPGQAPRPRRWKPPSLHRLRHLLTADPGEASGPDRLLCDRLLAELPDLRAAASAVRRLAGLLRKEDTGELAAVLEEMAATPLARFAEGLKRDAAAVQNALEAARCRRGCGGNWLSVISRAGRVVGSGGEVNRERCGRLGEALPSIDLAHGDLA